MRWFPWSKRRYETRADNYTEARVQAILQGVTGGAVDDFTAASEIARGLWSRGFASATVSPTTPATASLTPALLGYIGRQLHKCGQVVLEVEVVDGRVRLNPASSWDVSGGGDPEGWEWRLTLPGPSTTTTVTLPASRVINLVYSVDPAQPWRGIGPLGNAKTTRDLLSVLEMRLQQEIGQPVGSPDSCAERGCRR